MYSGQFQENCKNCFFNAPDWSDHSTLGCVCENKDDPFRKTSAVELDDLMEVLDDGYVECFGHISAPTD